MAIYFYPKQTPRNFLAESHIAITQTTRGGKKTLTLHTFSVSQTIYPYWISMADSHLIAIAGTKFRFERGLYAY